MGSLSIASYVTDFADQAVLLPLAVVVAVGLAVGGWRRGAMGWACAVGATLAVTLMLKLVFLACGHLLPGTMVRSPSGHVAASGAVYGGLFGVMSRVLGRATALGRAIMRRGRLWQVLFTLAVIMAIGASRLILGAHTWPEVLAGGVIAMAGAVAADRFMGSPPWSMAWRRLGATAILVVLLLHGYRLPAEAAIGRAAIDFWPLSQCGD